MLTKFERILFYPLLIIATVLALMSWKYCSYFVAIPLTIFVALQWIAPFFPKLKVVPLRTFFWVMFTGFLVSLGFSVAYWGK